MRGTRTLPGFDSPAAGFDQPFEMLAACHERVERSLALLGRLVEHAAEHGADAAARSAARDVLRYFDIAAPAHHEDEERHVFPPLLAGGDDALAAQVRRLQAEHHEIARRWARLRLSLLAIAEGADFDLHTLKTDAAAFIAIHDEHLAIENGTVFPSADRELQSRGASAIVAMGEEMALRRSRA